MARRERVERNQRARCARRGAYVDYLRPARVRALRRQGRTAFLGDLYKTGESASGSFQNRFGFRARRLYGLFRRPCLCRPISRSTPGIAASLACGRISLESFGTGTLCPTLQVCPRERFERGRRARTDRKEFLA